MTEELLHVADGSSGTSSGGPGPAPSENPAYAHGQHTSAAPGAPSAPRSPLARVSRAHRPSTARKFTPRRTLIVRFPRRTGFPRKSGGRPFACQPSASRPGAPAAKAEAGDRMVRYRPQMISVPVPVRTVLFAPPRTPML
ncbi:hypothetical protein GCM10009544_60590 [Streptomyces stramineus]|uniref:Uncharacterized protein n=1 Tax=Streptomyces stramineus TaxID=173861 RepID=A0ABN1B7A2_9ACTN